MLKLDLMGYNTRTDRGGPVGCQRIVTRNPFGTDVGIDLY